MDDFIYNVKNEAEKAVTELLEISKIKSGEIFVIGCSTSEILGSKIGTNSAYDVADAIFTSIYPICLKHGVFIAAQCCEHLNRALIIEREAANKFS